MKFSLISAVNNEAIVNKCLLSSPDIHDVEQVILQRGFNSAADAYNHAIDKAQGDVLIFIHQDIYLPAGWLRSVEAAITGLDFINPHWGVLGLWGVNSVGKYLGHIYCNGNQRLLGEPLHEPVEVASLDEVVLILRKDSGLKFDTRLRGFHFYGTDVCLTSRQLGRINYVIPGFCIHNTNGYGMFPSSFWMGYFYMRKKWKYDLPIKTTCMVIDRSLWPVWQATVWRFCWLKFKRIKLSKRVDDPSKLYTQ